MSRRRKLVAKLPEPVAQPRPWTAPLALALILLLTFLIYTPCLNGGRLWDDDGHLTKPELQSLGGLYRIWFETTATQQYYPLLHTAFWIEHKLWGDSMLGYHLINIAWHMVAVLLLYRILLRLKIPGALLATAIFAVHPVMVESVAWISEQKNTLSAVFYLSAMLVYLRFDESRRPADYFVALGLFVLGLLTKTVTATLPAALLVVFWWRRGTISWRRDALLLVPFFAVGAAAGILTAHLERTLIGAAGADFEMTIIERGLLAGRVVWFYLSKLFWPTNLIFIYPRWQVDPYVWWQWLFPVATASVFIGLWALRGWSRSPLAAWLLFVGTLAPVLGFLNVYPFIFSFVADHFQYLASLGIIVLVAAGIARLTERIPLAFRGAAVVLCFAVITTLATLSWKQSATYADSVTLYKTTIDRNPSCWMALNNLAEVIKSTNRDAAIAYYKAAIKLRPNYSEAHNNLGYQLTQLGRLQEAVDHLRKAIRANPNYSKPYNNLGIALYQLGQPQEAIAQFQLALKVAPNDAAAHSNLGNALTLTGQIDEGIAHYQEALRIQPDFMEVHYRLAEVLRQRGQLQEAIEHYQAALKYRPDFIEIYIDLAAALAATNQSTQAIAIGQHGIEVAHSTGQEASAQKLEEWLRHYQRELQRATTGSSAEHTSPPLTPSVSK